MKLPGDLHILIRQNGNLHLSQTPLVPGSVNPSQMRKVRIGGTGDDLTSDLGEFLRSLTEGDDLRRTHEGEVQRVEEQHNVFAYVVFQGDILELAVDHGGGLELRGRLAGLKRGTGAGFGGHLKV